MGFANTDPHHHTNFTASAANLGFIGSGYGVGANATHFNTSTDPNHLHYSEIERISPPASIDGQATSIQPDFFKTTISLGYAFLVTWITAFVMVVIHERVPDMKRYPPLPDISG